MLTGIRAVAGTSLVAYPAHVSRARCGCHAEPALGDRCRAADASASTGREVPAVPGRPRGCVGAIRAGITRTPGLRPLLLQTRGRLAVPDPWDEVDAFEGAALGDAVGQLARKANARGPVVFDGVDP